MNEKEKYYTEIETRLSKFNDTINELRASQQRKGIDYSPEQLDALSRKHKEMETKLNKLKDMKDGRAWENSKAKLEQLVGNVQKCWH